MSKALLAATLLAIAGPALAQPAAQPVPTPVPARPATKTSDVNPLVCETEDQIGSRLQAHKVCMTVRQWQQYQADNREKLERLQQSAGTRPSG